MIITIRYTDNELIIECFENSTTLLFFYRRDVTPEEVVNLITQNLNLIKGFKINKESVVWPTVPFTPSSSTEFLKPPYTITC